MNRTFPRWVTLSFFCALTFLGAGRALAQPATSSTAPTFNHPGGLHSREDLERMKKHVAAGDHPWIESWNALLQHPKAQLTYKPAPRGNAGVSRQRAAADAVAIYLNAIRGYISGDTAYTDHAIAMCNQWSAAVNQIPAGVDQPGLNGIYTYQFAIDGELLRMYVGTRWQQADFDRYKNMMRNYLYPSCHDFLVRHNNAEISHYWANWDASCIAAVGAIGVLCDDRALFDEAVNYFKNGAGNGAIGKAVYFVHPGNLGQWQETGRDEEHAAAGLGMLAAFCEIARHQGLDLYGYDNNRLLAGAEYTAMFNLWKEVPYKFYNNGDNVNQYWASRSQRGRLQRPIWEQLYNHYVVRMGLKAPNLTMIAALNRPEGYTHDDHFGFGTLTFTLEPSAFPPFPAPSIPEGLTASAGVGRVLLKWTPPATANGFVILRGTSTSGPFTELAHYRGIIPQYDDTKITPGTTYYYAVAAENQAGISPQSAAVSAMPVAAENRLPPQWFVQDLGKVQSPGSASYAAVGEGTFVLTGSGAGIGGKADGIAFTGTSATGNVILTARLIDGNAHGVGGRGRIGIMFRESLDPGSPAAAMVLGDVGFRAAHFITRAGKDQNTTDIKGNEYSGLSQAPTWFRIERVGNTFTAYQSDEGVAWYKVGEKTVPMNATAFVGFAIASDSAATISMTFDHLSIVKR